MGSVDKQVPSVTVCCGVPYFLGLFYFHCIGGALETTSLDSLRNLGSIKGVTQELTVTL